MERNHVLAGSDHGLLDKRELAKALGRNSTRVVMTGSYLLDKHQLARALGLKSVRIVDSWVRKRMIPVIVGGHRTRLFKLEHVLEALEKFEIKAIGQK